jgi:hypothetical protein|nr:PEGA domain-containing protein [Kofleriaceae bacterium]
MTKALAAIALALAATACVHDADDSGTTVKPTDAILYIRSNLADAELTLDGHFVGRVNQLRGGVAVEPGAHRIELAHDDYFASYVEVQVGRSERRKIALDLLPKLP